MAERKKTQDDAVQDNVVTLIKMMRHGNEPNEADVHPDEVVNYQAGGWFVAAPISVEAE